ncbi:MAG TPA: hypothetical protein VGN09_18255 [Vicinamibacteria bacterium]
MSAPDPEHERLRRYLLGELPEDEQVTLEERYFAADDVFAELLAAEDELVDAYLSDTLPATVRERFERVFLSTPAGRGKVRLAQELRGRPRLRSSIARASVRRPRKLWMAAVAAAAAVLAGAGAWLALGRTRGARPTRIAGTQMPRATAQPPAISPTPRGSPPSETPPPAALGPAAVSVTLTAGLARDAGAVSTLAVPRGATTVRLFLLLARDDYHRYRVSLQTVEGAEISVQGRLRAQSLEAGRGVEVRVSVALLEPRTYVAVLSGVTPDGRMEAVGEYVFRVTRPSSR